MVNSFKERVLAGRHHPSHASILEKHNRSVILCVTVCTQGRKPVLANPAAVQTLLAAWREADAWAVGRYVVMPDHLHFFCSPHSDQFDVRQWASYWKSVAARSWPHPADKPLWQRDLWDTQIRNGDHYEDRWSYLRNNPVRRGLVTRPEDWPYQGTMNQFVWIDP